MSRSTKIQQQYLQLLRDYGYDVQGILIIRKGVRGFSFDQICGKCRSVMDAAEQLCPIIQEKEYTDRMNRIGD